MCTAGARGRLPGLPAALRLGSQVGAWERWGPLALGPACNGRVSLLQEGQPLGRSLAAGEPEPAQRLPDAVRPAAGHDVLHPVPLAAGVLPAALPPARRQQTLSASAQ